MSAQPQKHSASSLKRFQLSIAASKLPKRSLSHRLLTRQSKPNPYAVVTIASNNNPSSNHYASDNSNFIGRTQPIRNSVDPAFTDLLSVQTNAAQYMPLQIVIYDDVFGQHDESKDPFLASVTFEAIEIFQSMGRRKHETTRNGAIIYASIEESNQRVASSSNHATTTPEDERISSSSYCTIQLRGLDLKNVEPGLLGLGRSDPFYEVSKKNADHAAGIVHWTPVYRSEHIFNHLNPYWNPFTMGLEDLCYGDVHWPLRITIKDWQGSGKHRVIGQFETTLQALMDHVAIKGNADRDRAFEVVAEVDQITSLGLIVVVQANLYKPTTNT